MPRLGVRVEQRQRDRRRLAPGTVEREHGSAPLLFIVLSRREMERGSRVPPAGGCSSLLLGLRFDGASGVRSPRRSAWRRGPSTCEWDDSLMRQEVIRQLELIGDELGSLPAVAPNRGVNSQPAPRGQLSTGLDSRRRSPRAARGSRPGRPGTAGSATCVGHHDLRMATRLPCQFPPVANRVNLRSRTRVGKTGRQKVEDSATKRGATTTRSGSGGPGYRANRSSPLSTVRLLARTRAQVRARSG
jgi:hypothetical protein